jgi:hypothetical protein
MEKRRVVVSVTASSTLVIHPDSPGAIPAKAHRRGDEKEEREMVKRWKFEHWAMNVKSRPWAATAVVLHRLQRMSVFLKPLNNFFADVEHAAFSRATDGINYARTE